MNIEPRNNKSHTEAFNDCTEEIAQVLEAHFDVNIEDVSRINELDNINGGSR